MGTDAQNQDCACSYSLTLQKALLAMTNSKSIMQLAKEIESSGKVTWAKRTLLENKLGFLRQLLVADLQGDGRPDILVLAFKGISLKSCG